MQIVPIQPVPNQNVFVTLGGQPCKISLYQKRYGFYCDLYVNNVLIIAGVLCENLNRLVRDLYLGFIGDLCFIDNLDNSDPVYTGLGTRYSLAYLETTDLLPGEG